MFIFPPGIFLGLSLFSGNVVWNFFLYLFASRTLLLEFCSAPYHTSQETPGFSSYIYSSCVRICISTLWCFPPYRDITTQPWVSRIIPCDCREASSYAIHCTIQQFRVSSRVAAVSSLFHFAVVTSLKQVVISTLVSIPTFPFLQAWSSWHILATINMGKELLLLLL